MLIGKKFKLVFLPMPFLVCIFSAYATKAKLYIVAESAIMNDMSSFFFFFFCSKTLGCVRTGSDNASDKRQNCYLSHARALQNFEFSYRLRACVHATNRYGIMLMEYYIIFIRIWHHIYWDKVSYLLEYGIIFIGIWHHIYWNMTSYLLEYGIIFIEYDIIFIGIWHHIYWNMESYLLECGIILNFIGIRHHIYWNVASYLLECGIIFIGI